MLAFGTENSLTYDVIGHEYMHAVEQNISSMTYKGESGALMEAYSDIFGELFEDLLDDGKINESMDWFHNKKGFDSSYEKMVADAMFFEEIGKTLRINGRNIAEPTENGLPDYYQGENWGDPAKTDKNHDYGYVHINNTIISHAAYLMWCGFEDNDEFEKLGIEEIADLFYITLECLPSDCTFEQFADYLRQKTDELGSLSDGQRLCVKEALRQVGLGGDEPVEPEPEPEEEPMTEQEELYEQYKTVLEQYSGDAKYALYDIDKDGLPELIVRKDPCSYIYTKTSNGMEESEEILFWQDLYEYEDDNGLLVQDGSTEIVWVNRYALNEGCEVERKEGVICVDDDNFDEMERTWTKLGFYPITDLSPLN